MAQDRFDQCARFVARLDPEGVFEWLLPGFATQMRFVRWLDTRTTSGPEAPAFVADTVAELVARGQPAPPWLALLECQSEPDPDMFARLLGQLATFWQQHRPDDLPGSRYQLVAAVINLTGTRQSQPASRTYDFPLQGLGLRLAAGERYLAEEVAADTLDAIERGEVSNTLLALIPLMKNGGEEGIIQRWLALAACEPNSRRRGELAMLALVLAELKPWFAGWQAALKEWNMRESTVIQGWINQGKLEGIKEGIKEGINQGKLEGINEGIKKGELEQAKKTLRTLVAKRFKALDAELEQRINQSSDLDALQRAIEAVYDVADATTLLQ